MGRSLIFILTGVAVLNTVGYGVAKGLFERGARRELNRREENRRLKAGDGVEFP